MKKLIVPSITIFNHDSNQAVNYSATQKHIEWLIESGVDMIVPGGSSGEFPALSNWEPQILFQCAVEAANKKVPVYGAICKYSTFEAIQLAKQAEQVGCQGLMVIVPFYMKPSQQAIMTHFRAIRQNTELPIILYNNPATVGTELEHENVVTLAQEGVIQGAKSSKDHYTAYKLREVAPNFESYYGHDFEPLSTIHGNYQTDGWFSLFPNVLPALCAAAVKKDAETSSNICVKLRPLINFIWSSDSHPLTLVKEALNILGRDAGVPRLPLLPAYEDEVQSLEKLLKDILE